VPIDVLGNWEITIGEVLSVGTYSVHVITRDAQGAKSFLTALASLRIKAKSIIEIVSLDLGWFEIFLIVLKSDFYQEMSKKLCSYLES